VPVGDEDGRAVGTLDWVVLLTAATGVSFALLNDVYNHFYSGFGLSPADVGIDQVGILSRTAGLLVFGALSIAALYALVLIAFRVRLRPPRRRRLLLAGLTCVIVFGGWISLSVMTDREIRKVNVEPGTAEPVKFLEAVPILDITVRPVRIQWLGYGTQPEASKDPGLLYFGRNDQYVVLYACRETLLVPVGQVAVYGRSWLDADRRLAFCERVYREQFQITG
jgi:hypothetical protein